MLLNASSSISISLMAFPTPGIIDARSLRFPIFFTCCICPMKSLKSNWFLAIFFCNRRASSSSYCSWARSTRETISPMPRIRSAIRSGWNTSRASIFSPVPTNLMGLFTTVRIERAAPPRVSPSSLVRTTPVKSRRSLKAFAVFTASCPVMASTTKRISCGLTAFFSAAISFIISSSTARRPAVSMMTKSLFCFLASFIAF